MSASGQHVPADQAPPQPPEKRGLTSRFRLTTLKSRLALALMLTALLPAAIALPFQYLWVDKSAEHAARNQLLQLSAVQQRRVNRELDRLIDALGLVTSRTQLRLSLDQFNRQPDPTTQRFIERILVDAIRSNDNILSGSISGMRGELVAQAGQAAPHSAGWPRTQTDAHGVSLFPDWLTGGCDVAIWVSGPLTLDEQHLGQLSMQITPDDLLELITDFPNPALLGATYIALQRPDGQRCALRARPGASSVDRAMQPTESVLLERVATIRAHRGEARAEGDGSLWVALPLNHDFGDLVLHSNPGLKKQLAASVVIGYGLIVTGVGLLSMVFAVWLANWLSAPFERLANAAGNASGEQPFPSFESSKWPEELRVVAAALAAAFDSQGRLLSSMRREVRRRRAAQSKLTDLANSDELTGLANRRFFMQHLAEALSQPVAEGAALLYMDLDRFKPVNDSYGHEAGDVVLKVVAERIQNVIRGQDVAARLGGDEFAVLLLDNRDSGVEAGTIAERIEQSVSQPIRLGSATVSVGCSIGVTEVESGMDIKALMTRADTAMYAVKQQRKGSLLSR